MPASQFLACCLWLLLLATRGDGYCWQAGRNPGFRAEPRITQLAMDLVRVSWKGLVTREECADNYIVKYWQKHIPGEYHLTEVVPKDTHHVDIKVYPRVTYTFQAVAREEKGRVAGVDWNKSKLAHFKTQSERMRQKEWEKTMESLDEEERRELLSNYALEGGGGGENGDEDDSGLQILGLSLELFIVASILVLLLALVVVGGFYRVTCGRRRFIYRHNDSMSDFEDEKEEEETGLKTIA